MAKNFKTKGAFLQAQLDKLTLFFDFFAKKTTKLVKEEKQIYSARFLRRQKQELKPDNYG
jgi:hypothetical protein